MKVVITPRQVQWLNIHLSSTSTSNTLNTCGFKILRINTLPWYTLSQLVNKSLCLFILLNWRTPQILILQVIHMSNMLLMLIFRLLTQSISFPSQFIRLRNLLSTILPSPKTGLITLRSLMVISFLLKWLVTNLFIMSIRSIFIKHSIVQLNMLHSQFIILYIIKFTMLLCIKNTQSIIKLNMFILIKLSTILMKSL
jgi:hypothetical protein